MSSTTFRRSAVGVDSAKPEGPLLVLLISTIGFAVRGGP